MDRVGRYVQHMLGIAQLLADVPGCELYVINTSAADTDTAWVTEVWGSQAELDASLTLDRVKASVERSVSLLAGPPERIDILPVGGIGLDAG
jgi:quinol monooxygenase YgiN